MEIKLDGNYIIQSDRYCYMLSEWEMVKNKKGKMEMKTTNATYHNTIESALKEYKEKCVRGSKCKDIQAVLSLVKDLDGYLHGVLEGN